MFDTWGLFLKSDLESGLGATSVIQKGGATEKVSIPPPPLHAGITK